MTSRPALLPRFSPIRIPLLLAALLALSACSSQDTAAPAADPTAGAAIDATGSPANAGVEAAQPSTPAAVVEPGPITPPTGPAPIAGTDYVVIAGGQPFAPGSGKIEVVEVFGYTCPACARFEPLLDAWKARQPADVQVVPVAAPFGGYWEPYAKAYYAADTLGLVDETHDAMFRAIHIERSLPVQPVPTNEQLAAFYAQHGADAERFADTMSSFAVNAKMKRASQFLTRSGVDSTPTLVVNGQYRITGNTFEEHLRIAEHLIARERAADGAPPAEDDAPVPPVTSD
ncbi:thiol:disulfide interchange protein DsbA/DsbL [Lysobacter sp. D1-1-M9]|uniref:thiol:disulfide interchange protein DsbA/DsbL n=1 Tax=Novilysobacter longmucuonensis TaxID=3098603 RepID=UPI002FCC018C